MDLSQKYFEETKKETYSADLPEGGYTREYVEWLENKIEKYSQSNKKDVQKLCFEIDILWSVMNKYQLSDDIILSMRRVLLQNEIIKVLSNLKDKG
jgi:hypothetical protein